MTTLDNFKLDNIDPEDFGDTLLKLEKSFGAKFADNSFKDAKTFGNICDIIESQINYAEKVKPIMANSQLKKKAINEKRKHNTSVQPNQFLIVKKFTLIPNVC